MSKLERLKEIIAHAYENAPAVRAKMEEPARLILQPER